LNINFKEIFTPFVDFIFPKICIVTGERIKDTNSNNFVKDEVINNLEKTTLFDISKLKEKTKKNNCFSLYKYRENSDIQIIIHHIKYNGFKNLGIYIGELIAKELTEANTDLQNYDLIIPIPLHKSKLRERGYNQSDYISKGINKHLKINFNNYSFIRKKNTKSQTKLTIEERYKNMKDAFMVIPDYRKLIKDKKIILVDDVITTGATISEACKTLYKAHASEIFIISAAFTVFD